MTYFLSLYFLLRSFIQKNKKTIFIGMLVFMFIMFGWSFKTADWNIYLNRFNNYVVLSSKTEPLFSLVIKIFNILHMDFRTFLIIISFFVVYMYGNLLYKQKYRNFILALYFIFPFIMDVSQIRFALASIVALHGIFIFSKSELSKKELLFSIFLIICASLIHVSMILCFLFFLVKNKKSSVLFTTVVILTILITVLLVTSSNRSFILSGSTSIVKKINTILILNQQSISLDKIIRAISRMVIFFVMFLTLNKTVINRLKKNNDEEKIKICNYILNYNIIVLLLIPFTCYSPDLYRLQQIVSVLNYLSYSFFFKEEYLIKHNKIRFNELVFTLSCILVAFINLYMYVLSSNNINVVFYPFFNNNIIFNFIKGVLS